MFVYTEHDRSYECPSFVETQATLLLKTFPVDFVQYPNLSGVCNYATVLVVVTVWCVCNYATMLVTVWSVLSPRL